MSDISPSAITTDAEFEKQIAGADFETIKVLMAERAVQQGLAHRDAYDPSVLIPTAATTAPQPRRFAKTEVIAGKKMIFEGDSEIEVERQIGTAFKTAATLQTPTTTVHQDQPRDTATGRFTADDAAAKVDLELKFKRGEISAADYLRRSGAVAEYLEQAGVPVETLKEAVAEKQSQKFEQSWTDATEAFKARHPEWVGGDANRDIIGKLLAENNLVDAEDKVAALEAAYNHARENGLLVENPNTAYHRELQAAQSPSEINAVNQRYFGGSGNGLFNR